MKNDNPIAPNSDYARLINATRDQNEFVGRPLKFRKGDWIIIQGKDSKREVRDTETFIADLLSYKNGWVKWDEGKPVHRFVYRPIDG
jgi:hypothetical protein